MVVTETNNDGTTNELIFTDSGDTPGTTFNPSVGSLLTHAVHDGQPVVITHIASGETASTDNLSVATPINVSVTGVTLDQGTMDLTVGGATGTLEATVAPVDATNKSVDWSSSDASVVTVADGILTPLAAGTAIITVTTVDGDHTATSEVTVVVGPVATPIDNGVSNPSTVVSLTGDTFYPWCKRFKTT
jgi:uncharacterized protein YjdB